MLQGFLLGLASGTACVAYCAPVFLPYLLAEGNTIRRNTSLLLQFLAGRLMGYLSFAVVAWAVGRQLRAFPGSALLVGVAYVALAALLSVYGFREPKTHCAAGARRSRIARIWPGAMPAAIGFLTGLNLCPPFLVAMAEASSQPGVASSLLLFLAFFMATSLFFIPFPLAGAARRLQAVRTVSRLAAGLMGIYCLYRGLILIYGGFRS